MAYKHSNSSATSKEFLVGATEFIPDKLYFISCAEQPSRIQNVLFFTIDNTLVYQPFYADFGPSNLSQVVKFCDLLQSIFANPIHSQKKICLYSSMEVDRRANAAFLICAYLIIVHRLSPDEAFAPLMTLTPPFIPYRDAGYGAATYHITILDCLRGLYKALITGLLDLQNFDLEEYDFYEKVENGDFNWITPKFLALANPKEEYPPNFPIEAMSRASGRFSSAYTMDNLIKYMLQNNIQTIIRLNNKTYDKTPFVDAGIEHIDLYFPDGTTPPDGIIKRFLEICETRQGAIAVHCKAGLGRTGTLIAIYLMKHYRLTACEVISFLRVVRPGSVVGPQQNFLQGMQSRIWKMHPLSKLPVEISLFRAPTYPFNLTRFNIEQKHQIQSRPSSRTGPAIVLDNSKVSKFHATPKQAGHQNTIRITNQQYQKQMNDSEEVRNRQNSANVLEDLIIPDSQRRYSAGSNGDRYSVGSNGDRPRSMHITAASLGRPLTGITPDISGMEVTGEPLIPGQPRKFLGGHGVQSVEEEPKAGVQVSVLSGNSNKAYTFQKVENWRRQVTPSNSSDQGHNQQQPKYIALPLDIEGGEKWAKARTEMVPRPMSVQSNSTNVPTFTTPPTGGAKISSSFNNRQ